jgi:DNA-binding NtrC family response regulator
MLISEGATIAPEALPAWTAPDFVRQAVDGSWTLERLEAEYIRNVLRVTGQNFSRAADILGINRKTLLEKRKRYGIDGQAE